MATSASKTPVVGIAPQITITRLALDDARWGAFVAGHPEALAFHGPAWTALLADCYAYQPFVAAVVGRDGAVAAGIPLVERVRRRQRRWVGLPFTDACPPLLSGNIDEDSFTRALDQARIDASVVSLEVRSPLHGPGVHSRTSAVTHTLTLTDDPAAVFATFHRSQVQRNIRRAQREGVVVRHGETQQDLTATYYHLHAATRRRLGAPVQPRRFFDAVWRRILAPGYGRLLLAYIGAQPIAGLVLLTGQRTITYKYGASDAGFWRLRPNHLLFWIAIRDACDEGYAHFDFGRSDLVDDGLRRFKSGWAAREEPLVYSTLAARAPAGEHPVLLRTARTVIRRSPAWVCTAAGEIFYRMAG